MLLAGAARELRTAAGAQPTRICGQQQQQGTPDQTGAHYTHPQRLLSGRSGGRGYQATCIRLACVSVPACPAHSPRPQQHQECQCCSSTHYGWLRMQGMS